MKGFIAVVLAALIMSGTLSINAAIQPSDIAHQICDNQNNGSVVFFNRVKAPHPLGKNTCGEMHAIYINGQEMMNAD